MEERSSVTLQSGGQKIFGILHMPKGDAPVPVVLFCHGFGGNKSGKFRLSVRQAEALSSAGIASFRIDCRGSGDSEGHFADTTLSSQIEDLKTALTFLQNHPAIDKSRISMLGRSLGAALAIQVAATFNVKSMVLVCPLFDAKPWVEKKIEEFHFMGQALSKACLNEFATLDTITPLKALSTVPMLILQACKDEILSLYHFEQYKLLRNTNTQFVDLIEANHDCSNLLEQKRLLDTTTTFLKEMA